jgi:hypothetical protein
MANKTIVQLTSKPTLTPSDLIPVGDASTAILYKRTIADLLGAGNAVTSTTGTPNYLPKFTSANVLGISQIFDNGTNVGIGTASPAFKLDVNGSVNAISYNSASNMLFNVAGSERMRITTTGNLAIGQTTATNKLVVNGAGTLTTASFVHTGVDGGIDVLNTGALNLTRSSQIRLVNGNTLFGANDRSYQLINFGTSSVSSDFLIQYWNGTALLDRLRIRSNGNVGIGVSVPAYRLDVAGDVNINGVFRINGTPINTGGGGAGTITGAGTTNNVPIWTSATALGDSPISISGTNTNILVGTTGNNAFLTMTSIAPFGFSWSVIRANDGVGGAKTIVYDAADHNWYTAGAGKMYLSGAGDLYINQNTISGTYKLDVGGAIRSTVDVIITSDKRVKDNIINVTDALSKVDAMQGVYYTRKDIAQSKQYIGFLAQDIEGTLPQVVTKDSLGNYGVSYGNITALHNEAIKELNKEIKYLKSIINGSSN